MAPPFSLAAVLALRQRREEAEERILAALGAQRQEVEKTLLRVAHELRLWNQARASDIGSVHSGAMQQASYARYEVLCVAQSQLQEQLRSLEAQRLLQQQVYLAARSGRKMLTELQTQQRDTWEADMQRREAQRLNDLFNARRTRH